jgi:hypothetical protein
MKESLATIRGLPPPDIPVPIHFNITANRENIPHVSDCNERTRGIPGWNEYVSRDKETALFWHRHWKSIGSPRNGAVADIRKDTRAKYHLAIRFARKLKDSLTANNIANSLSLKTRTGTRV